jgi:hypothetical protein
MSESYETIRIAGEAARRLLNPPTLIAAMRVIEEQERATRWIRETESVRQWTRLHEETEVARRIREMSDSLHLDKLALYGGGLEAKHQLLGSSMGIAAALAQEAERQRSLYLDTTSALHRAAIERSRQIEQLTAHARSMQAISESTYRLNGFLEASVFSTTALDAARSATQWLMPYNALERACSGVLDVLGSAAGGLSGHSSILAFAPIVLPNVAATAILASTNPKDLTQEEIDEALEHLSELIDVDGPTFTLQLAAVHPKLVSCLQTARDAAAFNTPERLSLVFGQLRRAIDFTLKSLAPEQNVRAWITNPKLQLNNNRPTRLACITYIFRNLYCSKSVARMVFADCVVFNRIYSQLSVECHTGMAEFDEALAQMHITRVEALLYVISCAHVGSIGGSSEVG